MRVDGAREVVDFAGHFDCQGSFGDQFACARSDDTAADDDFGVGIDQPLRQAFRPAEGLSSATGGPGVDGQLVGSTVPFGFRFGEPGPGNFGIGEDNGRNGSG